ncbi:MAG TPA: hypothetical protein VJY65_07215, partial [Chloroflexota bacterium]|nr:hypothetical protein [Chloroflexota bacterium]
LDGAHASLDRCHGIHPRGGVLLAQARASAPAAYTRASPQAGSAVPPLRRTLQGWARAGGTDADATREESDGGTARE